MNAEVRNIYRPMKNPAFAGELRSKTWAIEVYLGPNDEHSPVWEKRCREYWERQAALYGLEMGNFTIAIEPPDPRTGKSAFLSTWCPVLAVLPGERQASMVGMH